MEKLAWQLMLQTRVSLVVGDRSRRAAAVSAVDGLDFCSGESEAPGSVDSAATQPPDGGEMAGPSTDGTRDRDAFGDLG